MLWHRGLSGQICLQGHLSVLVRSSSGELRFSGVWLPQGCALNQVTLPKHLTSSGRKERLEHKHFLRKFYQAHQPSHPTDKYFGDPADKGACFQRAHWLAGLERARPLTRCSGPAKRGRRPQQTNSSGPCGNSKLLHSSASVGGLSCRGKGHSQSQGSSPSQVARACPRQLTGVQ